MHRQMGSPAEAARFATDVATLPFCPESVIPFTRRMSAMAYCRRSKPSLGLSAASPGPGASLQVHNRLRNLHRCFEAGGLETAVLSCAYLSCSSLRSAMTSTASGIFPLALQTLTCASQLCVGDRSAIPVCLARSAASTSLTMTMVISVDMPDRELSASLLRCQISNLSRPRPTRPSCSRAHAVPKPCCGLLRAESRSSDSSLEILLDQDLQLGCS